MIAIIVSRSCPVATGWPPVSRTGKRSSETDTTRRFETAGPWLARKLPDPGVPPAPQRRAISNSPPFTPSAHLRTVYFRTCTNLGPEAVLSGSPRDPPTPRARRAKVPGTSTLRWPTPWTRPPAAPSSVAIPTSPTPDGALPTPCSGPPALAVTHPPSPVAPALKTHTPSFLPVMPPGLREPAPPA